MFAYTQIFSELSVKSREKFVRIVDVAMDAKPSDRLEPSRFGRAQVPSTVNDAYRICRQLHTCVKLAGAFRGWITAVLCSYFQVP